MDEHLRLTCLLSRFPEFGYNGMGRGTPSDCGCFAVSADFDARQTFEVDANAAGHVPQRRQRAMCAIVRQKRQMLFICILDLVKSSIQ